MSSGKGRPFCLDLNVLREQWLLNIECTVLQLLYLQLIPRFHDYGVRYIVINYLISI